MLSPFRLACTRLVPAAAHSDESECRERQSEQRQHAGLGNLTTGDTGAQGVRAVGRALGRASYPELPNIDELERIRARNRDIHDALAVDRFHGQEVLARAASIQLVNDIGVNDLVYSYGDLTA